ncbi:hypothetical protein [Sphingomonas sp. 10B4]|uniref:hypothetical protein n=1 Tax=Sphingomonas sp. 10B4 TaxID=3048575 RepID=UPI002AB54C61|nr:hypothetical protein [Sphingomonas sp. 10B4]MDY7524634.1 hypothetical protein [Sphingomonas sp. 10B4]MEB0282411.1 hypothetical protein [Sphingomonas sp. 10B4]
MTDSDIQRVPSAQLEDLAFIVLSARTDGEGFSPYPDIGDDMRTRLRSRIKQLSRYDWPSSLRDDPAFRRGLTLRQCLRLTVALLLLDAHLPPSLAVMLAQNNELGVLRAVSAALSPKPEARMTADDAVAVIFATEIQDTLEFLNRFEVQEERIRFVRRADVAQIWSGDCAGSGARIIVDAVTATAALWRWLSERRLMSDAARVELMVEIEVASARPEFERVTDRKLRR